MKFISQDTRFEGEICFLMMNKQIEAFGFGLDLTRVAVHNKMKEKGLPWERAKAFDNFTVLGEFIGRIYSGDELLVESRWIAAI